MIRGRARRGTRIHSGCPQERGLWREGAWGTVDRKEAWVVFLPPLLL